MNDLERKRRQLGQKERELESARRTLDELEVQAAGIPMTERTAVQARSLVEQREKVEAFEEEIRSLTEEIENLKAQQAPPPPPDPPVKQPEPPAAACHIPFQNREDEIRNVQSAFAPPYFRLDAPAGYGKSELQDRLAKRFQENRWLVAHVRLGENSSVQEIVEALARELGIACPTKSQDIVVCGAQLARTLLGEIDQNGTHARNARPAGHADHGAPRRAPLGRVRPRRIGRPRRAERSSHGTPPSLPAPNIAAGRPAGAICAV